MEPLCDQETDLCDPATELTTSKTSRRLLSELKTPTVVMMARKRRVIHALFGILVGFLSGFLFVSRSSFTNWSYFLVNSTCSPKNPWPQPNTYHIRSATVEDDPLNIIQMTDSGETIHNSRKALLFVGVMTAQKYLDTRAVAVYETWGREIPGRIAFFSAAVSTSPANKPDLPLVRLQGVDDSYPPQKKSFLMLQYMWEHYGDRFEWFVRADDDVYVRPDKLELLLRSIDSRKPQYIGQAGRGNQEEFGLLSLEYDENFCMGGPGIIMSRETLARVAPHIKYCLKNLYTTHEDVELGRCVQKFAGIPCTWSYEMQSILYHNSSGADAFTGNLKLKEVHRAISLHPVKQHQHMYRIHNYMKALKIQDLQHQSVALHRDIASMMKMLGRTPDDAQNMALTKHMALFPDKQGSRQYLGDTAKLGLQPGLNKYRPSTVDEVIPWNFIARSLFSIDNSNPRRRIESSLREGLDDVVREVMDMINMFSKQRGRVIEYREILYGYHRLNPIHGADYILDLLLVYKKYRGRKMTVPVRRHVYLQQQFTGLEIRETLESVEVQLPTAEDEHNDKVEEEKEEENRESTEEDTPAPLQNTIRNAFQDGLLKIGENLPSLLRPRKSNRKQFRVKDKLINFILPLSGRFETFKRFLSFYEEVCLQNDENVSLTLVLFTSKDENSFNKTLGAVDSLRARYPSSPIRVVPVSEPFARARALELGAAQCARAENLLFFVDVDIVFTRASLQRIRANTIRGKQAYFPIVYSEYDPTVVYAHMGMSASPNHFVVNEDSGYWRQYGFGIAAIYLTDLRRVGGLNTSIRGWGKEDVDLFDRIVTSNLTVFRAADPHLVHVFHIVECDPKLDPAQLYNCHGTRVDTYGGITQLADYIYSHPNVMQFAKNKSKKAPS